MVTFSKQLLLFQNICYLLKIFVIFYNLLIEILFQKFSTILNTPGEKTLFFLVLDSKNKTGISPFSDPDRNSQKKSQSSVKSTLNQHIFFRQIAAHSHRRLKVDLLWFGGKN